MDEAEALSTKMGIMVKGGVFKCMGSSQHIKNKYGTGYEIELKVKKLINDNDDLQKLMARYGLTSRVSIDISETQ
jgi:ABC-type multidrug transport system ATPase subunit